ncbi:MAG: acyl-CoA thioesterase [Desulfovibrio sp.]|nr:acyl-CoA thioesterase [Desulfovibrio sp.]
MRPHRRVRHKNYELRGDEPALHVCVERTVRFGEVDAVRIMWHGHYASWLEDGREALGRRYGISYTDFLEHDVIVPVKLLQLDFRRPLYYGQTYAIHTMLLWNEAATLDFTYCIKDAEGTITTTASSTQLMLGLDGNLLLEQPEFYRLFCASWRKGTPV